MSTIYDVAREANVSPKTVSRVINGDAPVGRATREKVEQAIAKLGYVPSNAARMMRSSKSGLIGLITGAISNTPEPGEPTGLPDIYIVQGIQRAMASQGMTLMIADTGGRSDKVEELVRTFTQHRVEGLIYVADYHRGVEFDASRADCPVVLANCYDGKGTPCIVPDDRACQKALVERLIAHGHRRIGFLTLDDSMDASGLRLEGYRDALIAAGIPFDPALVRPGFREVHQPHNSSDLGPALEALLSLDKRPSVICCGNDEMALRLYGLLRTRGLRLPEEISVAGFDNYRAIAETLLPPLTTVELPYRRMGEEAAHLLLSLIGGDTEKPREPVLVPGPVVWRSSVIAQTAS
jgi:LacI family transcriptional regulator